MTTPEAIPVLAVDGVGFAYGDRRALDGVSFTVPKGRFTALLGPNGAGKSTLFALVTRLFEAPEGHIRIHGDDLARRPGTALARLGVVFQQPTLDLDLTVAQNLSYFAGLHGMARRRAAPRIQEELERIGLWERRHEKVRRLNGGHRRRAEIARALIHRPALLLLDEPTVGLDVPARRALIQHVHALCRDEGLAVLWATHLIDEIDATGDRVVILHQGRVQANGDVRDVLAETGTGSVAEAFDRLTTDAGPPEEAPCPI